MIQHLRYGVRGANLQPTQHAITLRFQCIQLPLDKWHCGLQTYAPVCPLQSLLILQVRQFIQYFAFRTRPF